MSNMTGDGSTMAAFVTALSRKDNGGMTAVMAPDIDFRALTPKRPWEAATPAEVNDILLGAWFAPGEDIVSIEAVETHRVADRWSTTYRLALMLPEGAHTVEQHAYWTEFEGRIDWLRLVCSGFRPVGNDEAPSGLT